jgi:hypothetical protein
MMHATVPLPQFPNGVPQNAAMRAHRSSYTAGTFGASAGQVLVAGHKVVRRGGEDEKACAVGSRGVRDGTAVFTFVIERTRGNDGLGLFLGVTDASTDFSNQSEWGSAYAIGCHGLNLFSFENSLGSANLVRGGLPGSEHSLKDGSVVMVRVDMAARELAFSVNGGEYVVAKGVKLPPIVRPFCKLAGFDDDMVSMAYEGEEAALVRPALPLPIFKHGAEQNAAMRAHGVHYRPAVLGPHGANIASVGATAIRNGGKDSTAAVVGARGAQMGTATFSFRIERTKGNDGLGVFVGVADSSVDYLNNEVWGAAWAIGCHGRNLYSWTDALESAELLRDALPGSEDSVTDGTVVEVRVDMDARPRELAFSVAGSDFVTAKGVELPETVRPFAKITGANGDAISLGYETDTLPPVHVHGLSPFQAAADEEIIANCDVGNAKLPRESNDSVLVPEVK